MGLLGAWARRDAAEAERIFPSGIESLHSPDDSTVDIVFIHGLTGGRKSTWTAQSAANPWPGTLLPPVLPTARLLTFGYDITSPGQVADHAGNLLASLGSYRRNDSTNDRPIIFVCHGLGGLVCEDALIMSRLRPEWHLHSIFRSTHSIAFIGILKRMNPHIRDLLRSDSEVLARIQDRFHTMLRSRSVEGLSSIEITCFYEELPILGIGLIVPRFSSILHGYVPIGIHENHRDMTKFAQVDHPGFVALCGELRRWAREIEMGKGLGAHPSGSDLGFNARTCTELTNADGYGKPRTAISGEDIENGICFETMGSRDFGAAPLGWTGADKNSHDGSVVKESDVES